MSDRPAKRIAKVLGAKIVGRVPDVGPSVFGAWRLARIHEDVMAKRFPATRKTAIQVTVSEPVSAFLDEVAAEALKSTGREMVRDEIAGAILEAALPEAKQLQRAENSKKPAKTKSFLEQLGHALRDRRKRA